MGLVSSCQSELSAADSSRAATEAARHLLGPEVWSCTGCLAVQRPLKLLLDVQPPETGPHCPLQWLLGYSDGSLGSGMGSLGELLCCAVTCSMSSKAAQQARFP